MPQRILKGIAESTDLCKWILISSPDADLARKAEVVLRAQRDALDGFKKIIGQDDVPVSE